MPVKKIVAPKEAEPKELKEKVVEEVQPAGKKTKTPQLLRGFRDVLPEEQVYWDAVRRTAEDVARAYSFDRVELPILEPVELFVRSVGKQTDIVEKEMFAFQDASGTNVVMRPEATASTARAYIEHGMVDRPQPVKMFYMGPMFRYDRPQAGRYRQFNQFGFEVFGSNEPIVDAQLIVALNAYFKQLGLPVVMHMNSIGTPEARAQYKVELVAHYRKHRNAICEDCKRRIVKNPMRVLDCKEEGCQPIKAEAPQILDFLDEASKEHFMKVLEFLDEMEVRYVLSPYLVRGLDYYSRTVFEIYAADVAEDTGQQSALGGGGRYDGLVELLGGRPTPAVGFAMGMERIVSALRDRNIEPPSQKAVVFLAPLGDAARRKGLALFEALRTAGIPSAEAFGKAALKAQLEASDRLKVQYTLILGQKEVLDGTIIIRDMESGAQETVDINKVVGILQKKMEVAKQG